MPISIGMPPARPSCLHNSSLWILHFSRMCAPQETKRRDGIFSSLPSMPSIRAIGVPFLTSFGGSWTNFGKGCTNELLRAPELGNYPSHSSSPTYSGRRALKTPQQMGPSLSTHNLTESSGIRVILTCHRSVGPR
jgi:hypothetical protein